LDEQFTESERLLAGKDKVIQDYDRTRGALGQRIKELEAIYDRTDPEDRAMAWSQERADLKAKLEAAEKEKDFARRMAFTEAGRYAKHLRTVDMGGTAAAWNIMEWCQARGINAIDAARQAEEGK
jgi:CHASE3 domain sensor protein